MDLPVKYDATHWTKRASIREEYRKIQLDKCWHCDAPLSGAPSADILKLSIKRRLFPKDFFKHPVHLHHCHLTGLTVGAVHNTCNAVLWQYLGQ